MKKQEKKSKNLVLYAVLILLIMSLLVVATYTWFSISRTPRVSNIGLYINAPAGMLLSTAPEGAEWVKRLDYAQLVPQTSPLRPVTWSERHQRFYAAHYGADGRQSGRWDPLTDEENANREDVYGYYIKATFYATSDTAVKVSLTHAVEVEEGVSGSGTFLIGSPIWDGKGLLHSDGGNGAQNAMRVGIRVTPLKDGTPQQDRQQFYIYEPNCDTHVDGTSGYVGTPSIDGTSALVDTQQLIRQTTTTWKEADPVQRGVVIRRMGEFETSTELFSLGVNEVVKLDMYVWLEGQDMDCDNRIGHQAQILANIQFQADPSGQSGLTPIP